ncbi:hypothetical protein YPH_3554 [Yersinia pestis biovar Orientalis str. PEXU2]|nr:hypothetical protein YPH_3554 [Yersinia pestis biovar Orientalis str. PEXU2]
MLMCTWCFLVMIMLFIFIKNRVLLVLVESIKMQKYE